MGGVGVSGGGNCRWLYLNNNKIIFQKIKNKNITVYPNLKNKHCHLSLLVSIITLYNVIININTIIKMWKNYIRIQCKLW